MHSLRQSSTVPHLNDGLTLFRKASILFKFQKYIEGFEDSQNYNMWPRLWWGLGRGEGKEDTEEKGGGDLSR